MSRDISSAPVIENLCKRYLAAQGPRVRPGTIKTIRYRVNAWIRVCGGSPSVSTDDLEAFRNKQLAAGKSARTIESTITTVRQLLDFDGRGIELGRKIRAPRPSPNVPRVETVGEIYRAVSVANWPSRLKPAKRCDWWRAFIAIGSWTGFRLSDMAALSPENVGKTAIRLDAVKTARFGRPDISIPITRMIRRHLGMVGGDTLFGLTTCHRQLRRELKKIADHAGVEYVCPQRLRVFAVNAWTSADPLAGQLIQGQSLGSMDHYLSVERHLAKVASDVEMPDAFFTSSELKKQQNQEDELVRLFRHAKAKDRQLVIDLARRMG